MPPLRIISIMKFILNIGLIDIAGSVTSSNMGSPAGQDMRHSNAVPLDYEQPHTKRQRIEGWAT